MQLMTKLITIAVFAGCLAACQGEKANPAHKPPKAKPPINYKPSF